MTAEKILEEIKRLDRVQWSQPSNSLAIEIDRLEEDFEAETGEDCPTWPERKWQQFNTELTPEGEQMVIPGCEHAPTPDKPQGSLW